ncbi:unnamed protein product [Diatraea saccharalis]|uniref:Uncharacterized protein n=1 Tax=Diatraea saccharalis TaxID=40085 RepID=A0A9N9RC57_9NEOP|nr:unnamed protein product [Diatraea saccharalis]
MDLSFVFKIVNGTSNFLMLILPTVSAGLLKSEAEKLQENIQNRILKERGREQESELQQFAEYVAARPMRFRFLRFVDLDWTMALQLLDLCIYYQIIITQFTHLF